ncbi:DUF2461 domain-containing protein [Pontibacter vulgaris]|uniref:DUF2461 domain-containing protein n=1 Tax=Pontibacter vulgaris TaxID=2905679 RepID=UPI001FA6DCBB|nr:DUF2461 domain-containing protein [Pontibacter vulgaris]
MNTPFILNFLRGLQANNSKTWMDENRDGYLQAKQYFTELVAFTLDELKGIDPALHKVSPAECLFRINKNDFSKKGEAPYKGRFGAGISPGGRHSAYSNYILVLEPGNRSRVGGGMPNPRPERLEKVRQEIDYNPGELEAILNDPVFRASYGDLQGKALRGVPKGYKKDHPALPLLKYKSYAALHHFSDEEVCSPDFKARLLPYFETVKPLQEFLNRTLED